MISDGLKDEAVGKENVEVRDLAEIVADSLVEPVKEEPVTEEPIKPPVEAGADGEALSA